MTLLEVAHNHAPSQNLHLITFEAPELVTLGSTITLGWDVPSSKFDADEVIIREWHALSFTGKYANQPVYLDQENALPANEWHGLSLSDSLAVEVTPVFPEGTLSWRNTQNVVVYALYLYKNGEQIAPQAQVQQPVYLRTSYEAKTPPAIQAPAQVKSGDTFAISWETGGLPFVNLQTSPASPQVWHAYRPFYGQDSQQFTIYLQPEQVVLEVTFTLYNMEHNVIAEQTVEIIRED